MPPYEHSDAHHDLDLEREPDCGREERRAHRDAERADEEYEWRRDSAPDREPDHTEN